MPCWESNHDLSDVHPMPNLYTVRVITVRNEFLDFHIDKGHVLKGLGVED